MRNISIISILIILNIFGCATDVKETYIDVNIKKEIRFGKKEGTENEILGHLRYIATDNEDNLYVMDNAFNKIKKYDKNGTFIRTYGFGEGRGPGEFLQPRFIDIDDEGKLYVTDIQLRRITVFNNNGDVIKTVNLTLMPADIVAFNMSEVFIIGGPETYEGDLIHKYNFLEKDVKEPILTFCERYVGENADIIFQYGDAGRICKSNNNEKIYYSAFYPNIIRCFTRAGKLEKEYSRDVNFYKPPQMVRPTTQYIKSYSGSWDFTVIQDKYIVNLLFEARDDLQKYVLYLDLWSIKNHDYMGIYKLTEDVPFGLSIITDSKGYLYTSLSDPFPHVQKYSLSIP